MGIQRLKHSILTLSVYRVKIFSFSGVVSLPIFTLIGKRMSFLELRLPSVP